VLLGVMLRTESELRLPHMLMLLLLLLLLLPLQSLTLRSMLVALVLVVAKSLAPVATQ
jgi:hypothetical protein